MRKRQEATDAASASYHESLTRWSTSHAAREYPSAFGHSFRDRCELKCIQRFAAELPPGSRVLDIPCGTGRLTSILRACGHRVVGADCSEHMVQSARRNWLERGGKADPSGNPEFEVRQALQTGFDDKSFDAVVCNRLFHHFRESATRTAVFREFGRICRGPMLVSFFNTFALDAARLRIKHVLQRRTPTDRIPIPLSRIVSDARTAGLEVAATQAVMWGISPMWYLVLRNRREGIVRAA